jgi:hypothetical protein
MNAQKALNPYLFPVCGGKIVVMKGIDNKDILSEEGLEIILGHSR